MIELKSYPSNTTSVNDEMVFVVYEATKANDETTYPNYHYICDVYDAASGNFLIRLRANPDPTYKMGIFDVAPILRSRMTGDFAYGLKADYSNTSENYYQAAPYRLKFGEEYSDTLYTDVLVDSERYAHKSYAIRPNTAFNPISTKDQKWCTNSPSTIYAFKNQDFFFVPWFDDSFPGAPTTTDMLVTFYSSAGVSLATYTYSLTGLTTNQVLQFNVGWNKLVSLSGVSATIQNSTSYITIAIDSQTKRIEYICNKYTPYTLAWINQYGAYECYDFGFVSKKSIEMSRKEYSRLPYQIANSSGEVAYHSNGVFYGSRRTFNTNVSVKLKMTSHILNNDEYTWLAELFKSPDVYLYDSTQQKWLPVKIGQSNYDYKTYLNSRLSPLEFEVMLTDNYSTQFL